MPYMGSIAKGAKVTAELSVAAGAGGSALLAISFADNGGGNGADSATVAPGSTGQCGVQTNPGPNGLLRVLVDFNKDTDTGTLTVRANGAVHDTKAITGDTTWSYTLS